MKLLHLIPSLEQGGAEENLIRLVNFFTGTRHNQTVFCFLKKGLLASKLDPGKAKQVLFRIQRGPTAFFSFLKLLKKISENKPDLIISWLIPGNFIASIFRIFYPKTRIIWYNRAANYCLADIGLKNYLMDLICRKLFYALPCCSISNSRWACKMYDKVKPSYYLPNPVPYFEYLPQCRKKSKFQPLRIGCLARWHPQKDHETLIHSLSICKARGLDFKLILAGPNITIANKSLKILLARHNLHNDTLLLGPVWNCSDFFRRIDIHVVSSSFGEGFPNVLVEACAHGITALASNIGEAKEILKNKKYLFPPKKPEALAALILNVALKNDDRLFIKEKQNTRKKIYKKYDINKTCLKHYKIWKSQFSEP